MRRARPSGYSSPGPSLSPSLGSSPGFLGHVLGVVALSAAFSVACGDSEGASGGTDGTTTGSESSASDSGAASGTDAQSTSTDAASGSGTGGSDSGSTSDATTSDTTTSETTGQPGSTSTTSATTGGDPTTGGETTGAPVECPDGGLGPGDHELELMFNGSTRSFLLHVPPDYTGNEPTSLVVNFHGLTSNAGQQVLFSQMNETADAEGFVVAYPQGVQSSWNAGECCGGAQSMGLDDVGFARAVVEDVEAVLCIDPARIYATGMSNGGFMTNRLACEANDLFAAFAPVSAVNVALECEPARPVAVMMFNGTTDILVPYDGGLYTSAPETFDDWALRDGCVGDPVQTFMNGDASCLSYQECDEGVEVTLCTIDPMGHCWPGNGFCPFPPASTDISANDEMWAFFQQHTLP